MGDAVGKLLRRIGWLVAALAAGIVAASTMRDLSEAPGAWHPVPEAGDPSQP